MFIIVRLYNPLCAEQWLLCFNDLYRKVDADSAHSHPTKIYCKDCSAAAGFQSESLVCSFYTPSAPYFTRDNNIFRIFVLFCESVNQVSVPQKFPFCFQLRLLYI